METLPCSPTKPSLTSITPTSGRVSNQTGSQCASLTGTHKYSSRLLAGFTLNLWQRTDMKRRIYYVKVGRRIIYKGGDYRKAVRLYMRNYRHSKTHLYYYI